jgi:3-phosphoshikimate 1-carboxyvinyltransferase
MKAVIKPSKAEGTVFAPPSKSMAHRMLICAGLSKDKSVVKGIAPSQDVLATLDCLEALGAVYKYENDSVEITGIDMDQIKKGGSKTVLNCRECGSTLRFFIPIALLAGTEIEFRGSSTLMSRPLSVYEEICAQKGYLFKRDDGKIIVKGELDSGEYTVKGNISSQFISGLLFALPNLSGDSYIKLIPPVESRSYIDMTIQALKEFGVDALWQDDYTIFIRGNQKYAGKNVSVEGDYSNAAFFEALNLAGGSVEVKGLKKDSLQGDRVYSEYFDMIRKGNAVLDISNCPDLGPVLFTAAAICGGAKFTGTDRLKIKESDRGECMRRELSKFGIEVTCGDNNIVVHGGKIVKPKENLSGHNDHRIVMALAVLLTVTGGVIDGAQAVRKSFPDFFDRLRDLKVEVETDGMDK